MRVIAELDFSPERSFDSRNCQDGNSAELP